MSRKNDQPGTFELLAKLPQQIVSLAKIEIANAKREAEASATKAKDDLKTSIARRIQAAEDQIASAENDAVRAVRDQAVSAAVAVASQLLAQQGSAAQRSAEIDKAIEDVAARMH